MFTGIVSDIGTVRAVEMRGDRRITIGTAYLANSLMIGASVACSGVCLTVTNKGSDASGEWFSVDVSAETASLTTAATWQSETRLNLERALKVGDELGGHIVTGHVDGLARVIEVTSDGDSVRLTFEVSDELAHFIAQKGSVTIEGVSLTVNTVEGNRFGVNIIPHTQKETTLGALSLNNAVNLEIDILARYVARLEDARIAPRRRIEMTEAKRVLIVVAPYYTEISDMLIAGTTKRLEVAGVEVHVRKVPGALEVPVAIRIAAEADAFDGYVALGCVIRGETTHYETVANDSSRGLMDIGTSWGTPIGNGILTVENREQAIVRADPAQKNKGADAAAACLSLIDMRDEMLQGEEYAESEDHREPTFLPDSEHFDVADSGPTQSA